MGSKSSKTKIVAPSANETAQAQSQSNLDAIYASALANRYNEVTPYGSITWDRPQSGGGSTPGYGAAPRYGGIRGYAGGGYQTTQGASPGASPNDLAGWTRTTTLSPEMQRQFDLQNRLGQRLQGDALLKSTQLPRNQFQIPGGLPEMTTGLDTQGLPQMVSGLETGDLPSITGDYQQSAGDVEQATYQRLQQLMNPGFQERQRELQSQLAATGNPLGSESYQQELNRFQNQRQEADLAAALESVGAGRQEQSRLFDIASRARGQLTGEQLANAGLSQSARQQGISEQQIGADLGRVARQQGISEEQLARNQNINELAALIQGSPAIQTPQGQQPAQYQVAPADILGAQQQALQAAMANQQQQSAKKGGTTGLLGTLGSAAIQKSDRRLKENIQEICQLNGNKWYSYDWNDKATELYGLKGKSFGVIADEVEHTRPDLIHFDENGYKMVNYGGLNG